ncbi:MAG: phenylalanine--tRNA ligase subunit beta [Chitinophagales bacterium]|nr:phenylalanine--tRNA ligase subunit beta [Bacteroidota bacterium]MCB9043343.1 phenylalanine--tRNA ligase subunit beta [Chitinophagales bacterium]
MKISYNWLKTYLPIDMAAEKVAEILTEIGLEVESIQTLGADKNQLQGLVVGEVLSAEKHPNADRLKVTKVNVGSSEILSIVCGAPNVAAGQKVVVATIGTQLFPSDSEPFTIKRSKIRGEISEGMLCAEDEIGIGKSHDGIMVLAEKLTVGTPLHEVINTERDYIFEIGLTPNRSDAFCHIGVAKDLAAALRINYKMASNVQMPSVQITEPTKPPKSSLKVKVHNYEACKRYAGVVLENIKVQASPEWLQKRLIAIGQKPINNVVDITNFVMWELGQPLHAFDMKAVGNEINVQFLPENTAFITLDEQKISLQSTDIMICNQKEAMCMAGVYGGKNSGVTAQTTAIFLESACFDAITIRKTANYHQLRTDAAQHFEKSVDPNITVFALKRAIHLLQSIANATLASTIFDIYPQDVKPAQVDLHYQKVSQLAGVEIKRRDINKILEALEMEVISRNNEHLSLKVPTNKVDVTREVDVIEEILRIYGFNNIPLISQVNGTLSYSPTIDLRKLRTNSTQILAARGFYEIMNNSLTHSALYSENDPELISLLSTENKNRDSLRKNMYFSALETISHNLKHKQNHLRLFEFGKIYYKNTEGYQEQAQLALYLTGDFTHQTWQHTAQASNFYHLKEAITQLLQAWGICPDKYKELNQDDEFEYGLAGYFGEKIILKFGKLQSAHCQKFDVAQDVFAALIIWDELPEILAQKKETYKPIAKYPSVKRDLALLLPQNTKFEQITSIAYTQAPNLLKSIELFDIFTDAEKIGADKKSYAVSFVLQDEQKTLTDSEIDAVMQKITDSLVKNLHAVQR